MIDPVKKEWIVAPSDISIKLASLMLPEIPKPNASGFKKADIATKTAARPTRLGNQQQVLALLSLVF